MKKLRDKDSFNEYLEKAEIVTFNYLITDADRKELLVEYIKILVF